ncbi:hypothetical protein GCM10025781_17260 [Kocuria gwangalliensis]|uniref:Tetratricopeptide repeat protein n=1 Tax=Kocuria gwangalliensis TaxID=501592 RepID=A0ABP8X2L5_9MICC
MEHNGMNSSNRSDIARQHMLGGLFRDRGNDLQVANDLLEGALHIDNHPSAQIDMRKINWLADPFKDKALDP